MAPPFSLLSAEGEAASSLPSGMWGACAQLGSGVGGITGQGLLFFCPPWGHPGSAASSSAQLSLPGLTEEAVRTPVTRTVLHLSHESSFRDRCPTLGGKSEELFLKGAV